MKKKVEYDKPYTTVNILTELIKEIDELVKQKPTGYVYRSRSELIHDALNNHIKKIKFSIKSKDFPDQFFDCCELKK